MKTLIHGIQIGYQDRFQKFAPNYLAGEKETELYDINRIGEGINIVMLVPETDQCNFDLLNDIKVDHYYKYPGQVHEMFTEGNDPNGFVLDILKEL